MIIELIQNIYKNINIYNISYNFLYFVSLCQIKFNKIYNNLALFINKYRIKDKKNDMIVEYYKNGDKDYMNINNLIQNLYNDNEYDKKYDFIIISDHNHSKNIINKIFVDNPIDITENKNYCDYEESLIRFLSLNICYNNNNYTINLKDDKHNYYVVNNQINKQFIKYYLEYILNICTEIEDLKYNMELIDHNVNIINLTEKDAIIIEKDYYLIRRNGNKELEIVK
jgi:hypothetical protein